MKKPVYYVILALLVGVFLFAAYKVGSYYLEKYRSDKVISCLLYTSPSPRDRG